MRQNLLIVGLGILVSFILFTQGEKYNLKTSDYGELVQFCESLKFDYGKCVERIEPQIKNLFGASHTELESNKEWRMAVLILPVIILIISVFVSFNVTENEKYLTLIALTPLFLSFLRYFPYAPEKWMVPFYLAFATVIAYSVSVFKRNLFAI